MCIEKNCWHYSVDCFLHLSDCFNSDRLDGLFMTGDTIVIQEHVFFMAPKIKMLVNFTYFGASFLKTNATFRSASTDLSHALVVCDLTPQIPISAPVPDNRQPIRDQDL